jgi:protein TonB
MSGTKRTLRSRLPVLAGGLFMLLFTAGVVWMVKSFIDNAEPPEKTRVQKISLVKPPPPKQEEKPPEPEKIEEEQPRQEEVQLDQPPTPDQPQDEGPPPGEQLGLDAEGGAGGDAFGLAARKGGRDITTLGSGGGGDREGWYSRLISRHFEEYLRRSKRLQGTSYQVIAHVWFDGSSVRQVRLARGSGNTQTDEAIREEIMALPPLREILPDDLAQPVRIRVASRA